MNPTNCRIHFFIYAVGSSPSVFKSNQLNRNGKKCSHSEKMPSPKGKVSALPTEEVIAFPLGGLHHDFSVKLGGNAVAATYF